jgi:PhzF family phenazine biosynthesis protein
VLFHDLGVGGETLVFQTRSAEVLNVRRREDLIVMDFPSRPGDKAPSSPAITKALGLKPSELYRSRDYMAVYPDEETVRHLQPDFQSMKESADGAYGIIVTAPGDSVDFVSRFFAPALGIEEDPVTGSAHCTLTPYWSQRLGKSSLEAKQLSQRQGTLFLENLGDRVTIAGKAVLYLKGQIHV